MSFHCFHCSQICCFHARNFSLTAADDLCVEMPGEKNRLAVEFFFLDVEKVSFLFRARRRETVNSCLPLPHPGHLKATLLDRYLLGTNIQFFSFFETSEAFSLSYRPHLKKNQLEQYLCTPRGEGGGGVTLATLDLERKAIQKGAKVKNNPSLSFIPHAAASSHRPGRMKDKSVHSELSTFFFYLPLKIAHVACFSLSECVCAHMCQSGVLCFFINISHDFNRLLIIFCRAAIDWA